MSGPGTRATSASPSWGGWAEAEQSFEETLPVILASAEHEVQTWAYAVRVQLAYHTGGARGSLAFARRALEMAEKTGSHTNRAFGMWAVAIAHLAAGEYEKARVLLEAVIAFVETDAPAGRSHLPMFLGTLGQALAHGGDCERVIEVAEEGIEQVSRYNLSGFASYPWYALALARIGLGQPDEAQAAVEGLASAIESTDMRALAPRVPECRAEIARLRGDDAGVTRNLTEALAAYRARGAHGHARRVEALIRD